MALEGRKQYRQVLGSSGREQESLYIGDVDSKRKKEKGCVALSNLNLVQLAVVAAGGNLEI